MIGTFRIARDWMIWSYPSISARDGTDAIGFDAIMYILDGPVQAFHGMCYVALTSCGIRYIFIHDVQQYTSDLSRCRKLR